MTSTAHLQGSADKHRTASVRTPEGILLHFRLGAVSERFVAMAIDLLLIGFCVAVVSLISVLMLGEALVPMIGFFFIRHCYFLWFETRGKGTTFGKRRLHLRVIRADGGPLSMEILLARNLSRDVEFFVPMIIMMVPDVLFSGHDGIVRLAASIWVLVPLLVPVWHPKNQRLGDLLAGTQVVVAPPVAMLADLADTKADRGKSPVARIVAERFTFSSKQLDIYGEHELKVLEDLLRKSGAPGAVKAQEAAAASIAKRIGFADASLIDRHEKKFLQAFYSAQRGHLEQQMLLGKRRLRKRKKKD